MELFKIGFITVTLLDVIDILIVTYIFYKLYLVMRGTIASQIFVGLTFIIFVSFGSCRRCLDPCGNAIHLLYIILKACRNVKSFSLL